MSLKVKSWSSTRNDPAPLENPRPDSYNAPPAWSFGRTALSFSLHDISISNMPKFTLRPAPIDITPSEPVLRSLCDARDVEVEVTTLVATYSTEHRLTNFENTLTLELSLRPLSLTFRLSPFSPLQPPIIEITLLEPGAMPKLQMYELESHLGKFLVESGEMGLSGDV